MKKYDSYKDSGVKWLGQIPSHWTLLPGLAVMKENKGKNSNLEYNTVLSLSYGKIIIKKDINEGLVPAEYNTYQIVKPGYIVIRCTDLQNDKTSLRTGLVKNEGIITSAYLGLVIDAQNNPSYIHYFLHAWDITKELYRHGSGLRQSLSWLDLKRLPILIPSRAEQDAIVTYLDTAIAKIDSAIAQQQKMIDLLSERKQIIINNAVTRGLDPNVKMKDSGVEWIGDIPETWEFERLKHLTQIISKGTTPSTIGKEIYSNGVIRFLKAENIVNNQVSETPEFYIDEDTHKILKRSNLQANDLLFVIAGATIGKVAILPNSFVPANTNQAICFIRLKDNEMVRFIWYILQSDITRNYIWVNAVQSAQPNISMEDLGNMQIPVPQISEQNEIVNYIDSCIVPIENTIEICNKQIALLQERKQIIINDVVTGKVKME